jgi:hypothetical protein
MTPGPHSLPPAPPAPELADVEDAVVEADVDDAVVEADEDEDEAVVEADEAVVELDEDESVVEVEEVVEGAPPVPPGGESSHPGVTTRQTIPRQANGRSQSRRLPPGGTIIGDTWRPPADLGRSP